MALSSALFSGVAGLQANQSLLDIVGNNLANSNTAGYKSQSPNFQDLFYQTLSPGSAPGTTRGGTNPIQTGFGVRMSSIASNFAQGALQPTGRTLDLAIQGKGFFIVNDGQQDLFTRAGAFDLDVAGFVVDAASGLRLQRTGTTGEGSATTPAFQTPGDNDIQIPLGFGIPGNATSNVSIRGNISAALPVGNTYTTAIQVFDTQGTEHALSLTFTKTAPNTFSLDATVTGGTVTGVPVAGISFNADGTLAGPASVGISLAFPPGLPGAQAVALQLGTVGLGDGLTQFGGDSTAATVSQDGYTAGTLVNFSIENTGLIQGIFSNGQVLALAQVGLAHFTNEAGLLRQGNSLFAQSGASGPAIIDAAGTPGVGSIQSGALEGSNVDVSSEFTRLIIAQRGFQINARAVTASSEVLQELANIVR
jgi:flagellar hook protein FlgE